MDIDCIFKTNLIQYMSSKYFDNSDKQYNDSLIINPPVHTKLEIELLMSKIKHKNVVDFGAGTGRLTIPLLQNKFTVTAVDVSDKSLIKLKKIAKSKKLKTLNNIVDTTDAIVGCDVLHHINIDKYFQLFYEKLKSGGQIVFSEPNGWNMFWYLYILLKLDWKEEKGITKINCINLVKKLIDNGYKNIEVRGIGILPGPFCLNNKTICQINYWLGNLPVIRLFSYRLLICARKN